MGCEPIGFALANREHCELDLLNWGDMLQEAVGVLRRHGLDVVLMNTPLCTLPTALRMYAHKSISDWKNVYAAECTKCALKEMCCGLFTWHGRGWKPAQLKAISEEELRV